MLSRALSLATAMLLIGLAAPSSLIAPASAQNLEAGKSPAQLFSANCTVCHKSARGLLKSVPPGELPGFLRQHYTTSSDMAKSISAYLVANGAGGGRRGNDDGLTRQGRELSREQAPAPGDAAPGGRRLRPTAADRQQAQPGPDGLPAAEQPPRRSRTKRQPPAEAAPAGEAQAPAAAETERPASQKQKAGKKNRRHQEEPKADTKPEADKAEPAKDTAPAKPAEEVKPAEPAKPEPKAETPPAMRSDPVPAVTPAPKEPEPSTPAPAAPPAATPAPEPAKPNAE
jgi:hypothetical protein